jgi:methylphosphotriester-DNA--protein-cysteine methyltransferase
MTHEEKTKMRNVIYQHLGILLDKVHRMFEASGELTPAQMGMAGDILKDIAKADSAMSKACYYDSKNQWSDDKRY